ncbi:FBP domain-containing protein [Brachybacterium hainanense]|uniref:FBP domain-containing protein n=1 Tax=Brachybacterium hainanense TaxID=1541174 RepID=A0ABV6RD20_9MICO
MHPVTESQIRAAVINASKGEAKRASIPDLSAVTWEDIDLLGWTDAKRPLHSYVALEVDGELVCLQLQGSEAPPRKKLLCAWCEDVVDGTRAALFGAPLTGDAGRRGNTIGTAICADFRCSRNVRRAPTSFEMRTEDPAMLEWFREQRIAGLRERSAAFVRAVRDR